MRGVLLRSIEISLGLILISCQYNGQVQYENQISSKGQVAKNIEDEAFRYLKFNNLDSAIIVLSSGLESMDSISDSSNARLSITLGSLYFEQNDFRNSIIYLKKGINLLQGNECLDHNTNLLDIYCKAIILLANNYRVNNQYDSSVHYLSNAYIAIRQMPDYEDYQFLLPEVYYNQALVYNDIGNYSKAINLLMKTIDIHTNTDWGDCFLANSYLLLSEIYIYQKDYYKAETYSQKAIEITKRCYSDSSISYVIQLNNLGLLYYESSDYYKAKKCFEDCEELIYSLFQERNTFKGLIFNNLADTYCKLSLQNKGIPLYHQAIEIFEDFQCYEELKTVYHNLGNAYLELGQYNHALKFYNNSLNLSRKKGTLGGAFTAYTFHKMGQLFLYQSQYNEALKYFNLAIDQISNTCIDSLLVEKKPSELAVLGVDLIEFLYYKGKTQYLLFQKEESLSFLASANHSFYLATELLDITRNQFSSEQSKVHINKIKAPLFSLYILALISLKNARNDKSLDNRILECVEKSKYTALRSLMDFNEAIQNSSLSDNEVYIIDSLRREIRIMNNRIKQSQRENSPESTKVNILRNTLFKCLFSYDSLLHNIELTNNLYKSKKLSFDYYNIGSTQELLDDTSVILNYCITDSIIVILAISKKNYAIRSFKTPSHFTNMKNNWLRSIVFSKSEDFQFYGKNLYDILISPVEKYILNYKHLIIIPDDESANIPYEGLICRVKDKKCNGDSTLSYLVECYAVSYHYSLNLWCEKADHSKIQGVKKQSIIFCGYAPISEIKDIKRNLENLPYSNLEIVESANIFNSIGKKSFVYMGSDVNKHNIKHGLLNSQIFHLATHSYSDPEMKDYYFQLSVENLIETLDTNVGDLQNELFHPEMLYLEEIYNMNICSELVTISSCCSGGGEVIAGEGTISLSRGFYYAGARHIVYSLWDISDKHAMEFMINFYENISKGDSYVRALQKTKIYFIHSEMQLPTFWCSFIINS